MALLWMSDISAEAPYVWVVISVCLFKNTAGLFTSAIMLYTPFNVHYSCLVIVEFLNDFEFLFLNCFINFIEEYTWCVIWIEWFNCPGRKKLENFGMLINTFSNIKKKSKLLIFCNTTRFSFEIPVENLNNLYMYMSTWDDILICKYE